MDIFERIARVLCRLRYQEYNDEPVLSAKVDRNWRIYLAQAKELAGELGLDANDSASCKPREKLPEFRHRTRPGKYVKIETATVQASRRLLKDGDTVVLYCEENGSLHVREISEFHDGRFAPVID